MSEINPSNFKITVKKQFPEVAEVLSVETKISALTARILAARGLSEKSQVQRFLAPNLLSELPDLKDVVGMQAGCALLKENPKAKVIICCDYDVDGLTSGSLLCEALVNLGFSCQTMVPNRFTDGYGLSKQMLENCLNAKPDILIAVDFGTSNIAEFQTLKAAGIKTLIIDHHEISAELPPADAFINPHQENCALKNEQLCSAGLTWCFLYGLHQELKIDWQDHEALDLAALGTICDMVPLRGLNRAIAAHGISALSDSKRLGLQALKEITGLNQISCGSIGYTLGPRINAAGRMADGQAVIELFTTTDFYKAKSLAEKLDRLNQRRQQVEETVKQDIINNIKNSSSELPAAIVAHGSNYHTGVVGIVAQRMVELFNRPAAIIGEDENILKGSVRAFSDFNVYEALKSCSKHLIKFGGHKAAGGFSLLPENLESFKKDFTNFAEMFFKESGFIKEVEADTEAKLSEVNARAIKELEKLAPFGLGHPAPRVLLKNLRIRNLETLKNKHLKINFVCENERLSANGLIWNVNKLTGIKLNDFVDIVARPEINSFRNQISLQLQLLAITSSR